MLPPLLKRKKKKKKVNENLLIWGCFCGVLKCSTCTVGTYLGSECYVGLFSSGIASVIIIIPNMAGVSEKLKDIQVWFEPTNTLRQRLFHPKDHQNTRKAL